MGEGMESRKPRARGVRGREGLSRRGAGRDANAARSGRPGGREKGNAKRQITVIGEKPQRGEFRESEGKRRAPGKPNFTGREVSLLRQGRGWRRGGGPRRTGPGGGAGRGCGRDGGDTAGLRSRSREAAHPVRTRRRWGRKPPFAAESRPPIFTRWRPGSRYLGMWLYLGTGQKAVVRVAILRDWVPLRRPGRGRAEGRPREDAGGRRPPTPRPRTPSPRRARKPTSGVRAALPVALRIAALQF